MCIRDRYCTKLLSGLGADVIKVERLDTGDGVRWLGPFASGTQVTVGNQAPEDGAWFLYLNTAKQSLALDLKSYEGRRVVLELAARADILVENFAPGGIDSIGLSYTELEKANPALVVTSISNFGQTGPKRKLPGYDAVVQAEGGLMSITGPRDGTSYRLGVAIADIVSGMFAAQGITLALLSRERTGRGQLVDIAMLDSVAVSYTHLTLPTSDLV